MYKTLGGGCVKPYVKNRCTGEVLPAVTRTLGNQEVAKLAALYVTCGLHRDEAQDRAAELLRRGKVVGILACGELCAACAVLPARGERLVEELGLGDESVRRCGVLDGLAEHPDFYGNGLEREAVSAVLRLCWRDDLFFAAMAVKPSERERLLALMSLNGMRLRGQVRRNGGHLYYLLLCMREDKRLYTDYNRYSLDDTYGITKALEDGSEGIATFRSNEGDFIWLAR